MTRFRTALEPYCWIKRTASLLLIEKPCQLMIALGLLVIVRLLPWVVKACLSVHNLLPGRKGKNGACAEENQCDYRNKLIGYQEKPPFSAPICFHFKLLHEYSHSLKQ